MATIRLKRSYFAMPYMFLSVIFVVVPLIIMLVFAFQNSMDGSFTFKNFSNFFLSSNTSKVLLRSFTVAFLTTVICFLLAFPVSLILTNSQINKTAILVMLFVLPMWINSIMRIYAVKTVFEMMKGNINNYIKVTIAMVYDFFPFMLLPMYTVLNNMDKSYIEASNDLGASSFKTLLKVKFPLSVPGIVSGVMMVFMPTVSTFAISEIIASGTDMYLFGNLINDYFVKGFYNQGSAYAFILLLFIAGSMFIANRLSRGKIQPQGKGGGVL